jgi:excisionase family DNA binding protein
MDTHDRQNVPGEGHVEPAQALNSVARVQTRTDLSRSTLYREMNAGRLGYVKVGQRRLIPEQALLAYIEQLSAA